MYLVCDALFNTVVALGGDIFIQQLYYPSGLWAVKFAKDFHLSKTTGLLRLRILSKYCNH